MRYSQENDIAGIFAKEVLFNMTVRLGCLPREWIGTFTGDECYVLLAYLAPVCIQILKTEFMLRLVLIHNTINAN